MENLAVVILAAGQGTRMKSKLPKVLHRVGDRSMLEHSYDRAKSLSADSIHIVYGHGGEQVKAMLGHLNCEWVLQAEQRGTGHAVEQAMPNIADDNMVLVLYGDVPLVRVETLQKLIDSAKQSGFGLLTANLADPTGYGRIVRDDKGNVVQIVEQKDANPAELTINEINTGMLAVQAGRLSKWISALDDNNAQGELYLTDIIEMAATSGVKINTVQPATIDETLGANNRVQLAELERHLQQRQAMDLMFAGVTLRDPLRFDLRGTLTAGSDVEIDINCLFQGNVTLGNNVKIAANCVISNSTLADNVVVEANSIIEDSTIAESATIGPFGRLRPGTVLEEGAKIGNFVEVKKSTIGKGSKVSHLSYIGDTTMGADVNIGAGTITCNYDGANKFKTIIEDGVFVGSDSQLVAPVTIAKGTTVGAGSTITKDTPADQLSLSRSKQVTISGWQRPVKNK